MSTRSINFSTMKKVLLHQNVGEFAVVMREKEEKKDAIST